MSRAVLPSLPSLIAASGHMGLFLLVMLRAREPRLARILALIALDCFAWNLADAAADHLPSRAWEVLDHASATLLMPLVLHFVARFVGRGRALRATLAISYATFGALSLWVVSSGAFSSTPLARTWASLLLAGVAIEAALAVTLCIQHLRSTTSPVERARTRLLLVALWAGVALGSTDLLRLLDVGVPRLTPAGSLWTASVLGILAARLQLLEGAPSRIDVLGAIVVAVVFVLLGLLLASAFPEYALLLSFVVLSGTLGLWAWIRFLRAFSGAREARIEAFASLGRVSAQLVHDLRNSIAAILASAQYLEGERALGRLSGDHGDHADLIVEQARRLEGAIARYGALGGASPRLERVDVNAVIGALGEALRRGGGAAGFFVIEHDPDAGELQLDRTLIEAAIENLARNAMEASRPGGRIWLRTRRDGETVWIEIEDEGEGMNARTVERVLEGFFSTKPGGSGLGLSLARRVAEVHGGTLALSSREGVGTQVVLRFPACVDHEQLLRPEG